MGRAVVLAVFAGSGAVAALAFPPFGFAWVAWIALAPAMTAAACTTPRMAALGGLIYGLVFGHMLVWWFYGLFGWAALVLHLVVASFYVLIFACVQATIARWGRHALLRAVPLFWVGVEFFRSECWWLKFSWFGLGYSQYENVPLLQAASVGGVYLLSLLIAAANGAVAYFLLERRIAAPIVAAVFVIGVHLAGRAMLQPVAGDRRIVGIEGEERYLQHYLDASRAAPPASLIVWPELAVAHVRDGGPIGDLARERNAHVLVGGKRGSSARDWENTLFLIAPDGRIAATQVKSVPVQFFNDGKPATDRVPMRVGDVTVGAAICYDMDFPYVTRELVAEGAELLVYPTLDHRDWGRVQHLQHMSMTALRAVEHRRWVVRVASSGGSCVVDPYGRVVQSTPVMGETTLVAEVARRSDRTIYTLVGYYLPHACLAFAVVLLFVTRGAPKRLN